MNKIEELSQSETPQPQEIRVLMLVKKFQAVIDKILNSGQALAGALTDSILTISYKTPF